MSIHRGARLALLGLLLVACRTAGSAPSTDGKSPPRAPQRPASWTLHGKTFEDPFLWMRNAKDPALLSYVRQENAYAENMTAHLGPRRKALSTEILQHIQREDHTVPARRGPWSYWEKHVDGKDHPIHMRQKDGGPEEVLLDVNVLAAGHESLSVTMYDVNDPQELMVYLVDVDGSERHHVLFKDLQRGTLIDDGIRDAGEAAAFLEDPRTVLYTRLNDSMRPYCVMRHVVGTPTTADVMVHEEKDPTLELTLHRTLDGDYAIFHAQSTTATEEWAMDARHPQHPFLLAPRKHDVIQTAEHGQGRFFLLTNDGAPNYKVLSTVDPAKVAWRELVPHRVDVSLSSMAVFDGAVVLAAREDAVPQLRLVDGATGKERVVKFASTAHTLAHDANLESSAKAFRYVRTSFVEPQREEELDLVTGEVRTLKVRTVPGFDATLYAQERINVATPDGVQVPVILASRRDTPRNGTAAGLLMAYGSYGIPLDPDFDPSLLVLMDHGMVVALAQVRGGDERGGAWREAGRLKEKHHTFEDIITVAESLHSQGIVARGRLALRGGSAGGLLVGAVINLRPDLFGAAVAEVPFVDVLQTMLDADAPLTALEYAEWGNPNNAADFDVMAAYSPFDNTRRQAYPPMLVTSGLHDPRVQFFEAARWVARLRSVKTDDHPLFLRTLMDSGHGGVTGLNSAAQEEAWVQAFLLDVMAVEK